MTPATSYDLITMGRSCIDLYANDVGVPFPDIESFAAYVGGSPTNIAVGSRRLGLKVALLTAIGQDPIGEFIMTFLERENIDTSFIPTKPSARSSAVVLGIEAGDSIIVNLVVRYFDVRSIFSVYIDSPAVAMDFTLFYGATSRI